MISVIISSNDALDLLVKLIGVDLKVFDNKKMNVYDLAINYQN
jgi:hypothetical protein